jgi:hypothetical protein
MQALFWITERFIYANWLGCDKDLRICSIFLLVVREKASIRPFVADFEGIKDFSGKVLREGGRCAECKKENWKKTSEI